MPSEAERLTQAGLTARQARCLALYCYDRKSMEQIGVILGIGWRRVQRHIEAAQRKLRKAKLPAARRLEREPGDILTNMAMDRLSPDEIRTVW